MSDRPVESPKVGGSLLLMLLLVPLVVHGEVLLLHGWMVNGLTWATARRILVEEPYKIPSDQILSPTLPARASLVRWADDIASYIDRLPEGVKLTVVAHSFSGPASLFLLVASHHIEDGDLEGWAESLRDRDPDLSRVASELSAIADLEAWLAAAKRVEALYLYQPALGGGCLACTVCEGAASAGMSIISFFEALACDDAVKDMCLLERTKGIVFSPEEIGALEVPVVDVYTYSSGCPGPCAGRVGTDGFVPIADQRLFLTATNYHEVFGGYHCHADYVLNLESALDDLFAIVFKGL